MSLNFWLDKVRKTTVRYGFATLVVKITKRLVATVRNVINSKVYTINNWEKLKDKYKGKRVFLIGNGPSLNKIPMYLLKNEYTMCFNHFPIMIERIGFVPTFFSVADDVVLADSIPFVKEFIPKTTYSFFPAIHFRGTNFFKKIGHFPNVFWFRQLFKRGFSEDLPDIIPGGTVIYEGFQILNYLGFKEIYILGVDMNYKIHTSVKYIRNNSINIESMEDDDPNHFDPRYFGKNKKYHQPESYVIQNIINELNYLSSYINSIGLQIINVGVDSKVKCFKKKSFDEVLNLNEEQKLQIFNKLISEKTDCNNVDEYKNKYNRLDNFENISWESLSSFYTTAENGISIINQAVFTHLPLGPYNQEYLFMKRSN